MIEELITARKMIEKQQALIHCITSPIAINDCANAVLALGASPIMAEHPKEVEGITKLAKALSVSLANITDVRAESMFLSGKIANENKIHSVIDLVGITCSEYRMHLAKRYCRECKPSVIKGNLSEIKALLGVAYDAVGIDAGKQDKLENTDQKRLYESAEMVRKLAESQKCIVLATGAVDLMSDGTEVYAISNGTERMSKVTGTGCVLSCILAACLSDYDLSIMHAAILATVIWGICGEHADSSKGLGTFHISLLDQLSEFDDRWLLEEAKIEQILM